jgi:hypothetical protein
VREYFDDLTDECKVRLLELIGLEYVDGEIIAPGPDGKTIEDLQDGLKFIDQMIQEADDPDQMEQLAEKRKILRGNITRLQNKLKLGRQILDDFNSLRGYFPLMRFGNYTVTVKNKDGDVVHFEMVESKLAHKKLVNELRAQYGSDHTVSKGRMEQHAEDALVVDPRIMSMLQEYAQDAPEMVDEVEQQILKTFTFGAYMGLNIKSAVVNLTQIPMTLYPYLAGKYGDAKAVKA